MEDFISTYTFDTDTTIPDRILSCVKIGDIYMYRVVVAPGAIGGNHFHRLASIVYYVEQGEVLSCFEQIRTKERKEVYLKACEEAIHIPPFVAHATKNIGDTDAVIVMFTNRRVRSGDDYFYEMM